MAFESLSERLNKAIKNISGQGKLTEKNMNEMLKEVRLSLLEADVNYNVVKEFVENVKEKALGQEVMDSLNPGQMVVKIVRDEIQTLLGEEDAKINFKKQGITTLMMVGLQGTGKTTASAKIARYCKQKLAKRVLLVACDVVRPAAIEQLQTLGKSIDIEVFTLGAQTPAVETARQAMRYAADRQKDLVIFDTAGRLHIDDELMNELSEMKELVKPDDILLTVDAMTGQDAVNVAESFHNKIGIDGVIVTKLDGDTRGGAALSIKAVTGRPILYVGMGEKLSDLEQFYPDRMASRILGMGDVLTLIEKAGAELDEEKAMQMADKMKKAQFDFEDYLMSMEQMRKMGGLSSIMSMMPGLGGLGGKNKLPDLDSPENDKKMARMEAIIYSMTPEERKNPDLLNPSRKHRIAKGAGVDISEVNRMVKQFNESRKMMKKLPGMMGGKGGKKGRFRLPF